MDPSAPSPDGIKAAARVIRRGGVVAFPTRCLYGLGADAFNPGAVEKVFQIKDRPHHKPILVLIRSKDILGTLVRSIPSAAYPLMERFWPGRLTLLFEAAAALSPRLTAGTGKIGVRLPGHSVASALVRELENPITGTSANLSGSPGISQVGDLSPILTKQLDLILDSGLLKGGVGSTVVDITVFPPKVLREGGIPSKDLFRALSIPA